MLAHCSYSKSIEKPRIATRLSYNVDGIILSDSFHTERAKRMQKTTNVPVVEIMDSVSPALTRRSASTTAKPARR